MGKSLKQLRTILLALPCLTTVAYGESPYQCHYQVFKWDTIRQVSTENTAVRHPYRDLKPEETDPATGCTVCEEDQEIIELPGLKSLKFCGKLAPALRETLLRLINEGEPIVELEGYRVGLTRGAVDANGHRTGFSNHSFGIALDINPAQNGLYKNCVQFGPQCQLVRGGPWQPGAPGTLTVDGPIVRALADIGLRWGGKIEGRQKDFMHFSPGGY